MFNEILDLLYACPTLYRETDYEMKQLFISILRLNRHQLVSQVLDQNYQKDQRRNPHLHLKKHHHSYDIEFNCFFDRCWDVKTGNPKVKLNEYSTF